MIKPSLLLVCFRKSMEIPNHTRHIPTKRHGLLPSEKVSGAGHRWDDMAIWIHLVSVKDIIAIICNYNISFLNQNCQNSQLLKIFTLTLEQWTWSRTNKLCRTSILTAHSVLDMLEKASHGILKDEKFEGGKCQQTWISQHNPTRRKKGANMLMALKRHDDFILNGHNITYLPHKAVAEVSKDKEPIGRERAEFNWFESQLMSDSNELRVKWFGCHLIWDSNDFGCQLIWDSIDLVVNRCVLQMILVVCWFELQMSWLSIDLRFKWFGCQLIWDSNDLVVNRFEIKWVGCQLIWDSSDLDVKWFEV